MWIYNDKIISIGESFLYKVSINIYKKNLFKTFQTKYYTSNKFIKGVIENQFYKYPKFLLEKEIELIEAPLKWLQENGTYKIQNI